MTDTPSGVATAPAAAAASGPRAAVGVLLVHGIGDHQEGETLSSFGEPLLDWIRDWLRRGNTDSRRDPVTLGAARLRAARNEAESPACVEATIRASHDGEPDHEREERWLWCEAWWGDAVRPPDALQLLLWLWSRGPLLICWHFFMQSDFEATMSRRERERLGARLFAAVGLAAACQLVVTVALLLWLIPIGRWRGAVVRTVRTLTLTLGDSFVLLEHDIQRAALVERVRRSLAWLSERCTTVAVVAHSQGGAIAYEALASSERTKVAAFVSVGSGLEKLLFLRMVRREGNGVLAAALAAPVTIAALAFGASGLFSTERWHLIPAAVCMAAAIGLLASLMIASNRYRTLLAKETARLALHRTTASLVPWTDVAASHDLVPQVNDSLIGRQPFVTGYITVNERSYVYDHIGYFASRTSAMPRIWQALSRASSLPLFTGGDAARLERFDVLHGWHAVVLMFARWMTYVALFVGLFAFRNTMVVFGGRILAAVEGSPFRDVLTPVAAVADGIAWFLGAIGVATRSIWLSQALVGSLVLVVGLVLWSLAFKGFWRSLAARRWRLACAGGDVLDTRANVIRAYRDLLALGALSTVPLLYASTMIAAPALLQPSRVGIWFATALAVLCFLAAAVAAIATPWSWPLDWPVATAASATTPASATLAPPMAAPALDPRATLLVATLAYPLSSVLLIVMLTAFGSFVWEQARTGSTAGFMVAAVLLHAVSWQAYGLSRPRADVGPLPRAAVVVVPMVAWLWARMSFADGAAVAFVYAGVAVAAAVAAVLSRRGPYVRAAVPAVMRALGRQLELHR